MGKKSPAKSGEVVDEALENARSDRGLILEAFEEMKGALKIETSDDLQRTMLVGEKAVKLLEALTKNNTQLVKIAEMKQKQEEKVVEDEDEEELKGSIADIVGKHTIRVEDLEDEKEEKEAEA